MKYPLILFIVLFFPLISSQSINYQIIENKVLVEIEVTENSTILLPQDYSALNIEGNYTQKNNYLFIYSGKIKFISKTFLEKSINNNYFISSQEINKNNSIKVYLPEKAILSEEMLIFPKNYSIQTDGRRIFLEWEKPEQKEIFVSYTYEKNYFWIILISIIIIFSLFVLYFYRKKNKRKNLTINLFKEEKEIINYLLNKKDNSSWTKEIVRTLGISKVKLSRKIRNLEEKGLIQKIPYGNENKIILKK